MAEETARQFLYLTTTGRSTGLPRQIEIWLVSYDDAYYLCSEGRDRADWVKNIRANDRVTVSIGSREAAPLDCRGRALDPSAEPERAAAVAARFDAKYGWSDGLFVELRPVQG